MIRLLAAFTALIGLWLSCAGTAEARDAEALSRLAAEIAEAAAERAQALTRAPAAPAVAPDAGDPLILDLQDFALQTLALSREIEDRGGPQDLRCIFRGMGRDVSVRLEALETAPDRAAQSRAYREIERLARQAQRIAADPEARGVETSYRTCEAEAAGD